MYIIYSSIYSCKLTLDEIAELLSKGIANIDQRNNFLINGKIVAVIIYKIDLFNDITDNNFKLYSLLESSSAIKCPSVFNILSRETPVKEILLSEENIAKCFNEKELYTELLRFLPRNVKINDLSNEEQISNFEQIKLNKDNWLGIYYDDNQKSTSYLTVDESIILLENGQSIIFKEKLKSQSHEITFFKNNDFATDTVKDEVSIYGGIILSRNSNTVIRNKNIGYAIYSYSEREYDSNKKDKIINIPLLIRK